MTKRAVLYARKSTIDKAAWAGLESQLELGREYAEVGTMLRPELLATIRTLGHTSSIPPRPPQRIPIGRGSWKLENRSDGRGAPSGMVKQAVLAHLPTLKTGL